MNNKSFKLAVLCDLLIAILAVIGMICVLITKEVTVVGYVLGQLIIIIESLTLALTYKRMTPNK